MAEQPILVEPIGYVECGTPDAEIPRRRRELVSDVVIGQQYVAALLGIEAYSHVFVLFWMHKVTAGRGPLQAHPRGRADLPLTGVFSARGRDHPNPIGLAVCELIARLDNRLRVRRLDAYDGSPVLDVKPYDPYDVVTDPRVPEWWSGASPAR